MSFNVANVNFKGMVQKVAMAKPAAAKAVNFTSKPDTFTKSEETNEMPKSRNRFELKRVQYTSDTKVDTTDSQKTEAKSNNRLEMKRSQYYTESEDFAWLKKNMSEDCYEAANNMHNAGICSAYVKGFYKKLDRSEFQALSEMATAKKPNGEAKYNVDDLKKMAGLSERQPLDYIKKLSNTSLSADNIVEIENDIKNDRAKTESKSLVYSNIAKNVMYVENKMLKGDVKSISVKPVEVEDPWGDKCSGYCINATNSIGETVERTFVACAY